MHVGAKSALQELPTMKKRCKRADMRFPIEKLVDFPALNAYRYSIYLSCVLNNMYTRQQLDV